MTFPKNYTKALDLPLWSPAEGNLSFDYSDGSESEQYLKNAIEGTLDRGSLSVHLAQHIKDWPSEYHLSTKRGNIFRPLQLSKEHSVLELGCGCGAITRYLGETVGKVTAVEGSPQRAQLAALRCQDLENVQIVNGNFQDVEFAQKFDVVTLIGVLEYSGKFIDSDQPYQDALLLAKKHLKDDGVLIIAIENKLGLKYFSGSSEDHTNIHFDGIEGYSSNSSFRTFGRQELASLVKSMGLSEQEFLYPFPDYKMPSTILRLDSKISSLSKPFWYQWLDFENSRDYTQAKVELFNEHLAAKQVEANGMLADMSNSFIVLASASSLAIKQMLSPKHFAWKYNVTRAKPYMTQVLLEEKSAENATITRQRIFPDATTVKQSDFLHQVPAPETFIHGQFLSEALVLGIRSAAAGDSDPLKKVLKTWYDFLNDAGEKENCETGKTPGRFLDCLPWNLVQAHDEQEWQYIDQEWSYHKPLSIHFILFRGLLHSYRKIFPWLNGHWDNILSQLTFPDFFHYCLSLLELEMTPEEEKASMELEWKFQDQTLLYSPFDLDSFSRQMVSKASVGIQQAVYKQQQNEKALNHLQERVNALNHAMDLQRLEIESMESSKFWKLRSAWFVVKKELGPLKPLFHQAKRLKSELFQKYRTKFKPEAIAPVHAYEQWRQKHEPTQKRLSEAQTTLKDFQFRPCLSILMPVYNTPEIFLQEAIESVLKQVYDNWELCIADDASTAPHIRPLLEKYAAQDSRIKVCFREKNGHISQASNSALELVQGEFVALFDHDDLLTSDALFEMVSLLNKQPDADMIYSDEDKIDENGQLCEPYFKPDWCPDSFLSRMYTCHFGVYRTSLVREIGGFREGMEGSQDYDLALRLTEKTERIFHAPKILYHWRIHQDSTAGHMENKNYAADAGKKAISEALDRRGEPGFVEKTPSGHLTVRYYISNYNKVSVIIPTRNLGSVLDTCLRSIFEKTKYPNYEIVLLDNGSNEPETLAIIEDWQSKFPDRFVWEKHDVPFNYAKINNHAVKKAKGKYLLFLNNDTEVIHDSWMDAMVEQAQRPSIGAVGAKLLYPDKTIQHAGVVAGIGGVAGHSHKFFDAKADGYFDQLQTINNYSAVTAACLMCRRDVFEAVGGFEEKLAYAFNDVDLCFKIVEKGYRNIYLPHVSLYHHESKSRGYEDTPEKQKRFSKEITYMQERWSELISNDPCYSPHLTDKHEDYRIKL